MNECTLRRWYWIIGAAALLAALWSSHPAQAEEQRREYVRVTFYTLPGRMANTERVHIGAAACSTGFPMGTRLAFEDGFIVECKDRGYLGRSTGWIDVWAPSYAWGRRYITGDYGDYAWVSVLRWGYAPPEEEEE